MTLFMHYAPNVGTIIESEAAICYIPLLVNYAYLCDITFDSIFIRVLLRTIFKSYIKLVRQTMLPLWCSGNDRCYWSRIRAQVVLLRSQVRNLYTTERPGISEGP